MLLPIRLDRGDLLCQHLHLRRLLSLAHNLSRLLELFVFYPFIYQALELHDRIQVKHLAEINQELFVLLAELL